MMTPEEVEKLADGVARNLGHDLHEGYVIPGYRMPIEDMEFRRHHTRSIVRCLIYQLGLAENPHSDLASPEHNR